MSRRSVHLRKGVGVAKASKQTASRVEDMGVLESRSEELGGYTVEFTTFREDADATPFFKGLPDDRCQSPHWGYVLWPITVRAAREVGNILKYVGADEPLEARYAYYM
jgi:hypothetical protein